MASEKGPVATEAPSVPHADSQPSVTEAPVSVESLTADATRATQSLKRHREGTPASPSSALPAQFNSDLSPASKAARLLSQHAQASPVSLTAAAALEDQRRLRDEEYQLHVSGASENPAYKAQSELLSGAALAMSRPQDVPMQGDETQGTAPTDSIPTPTAADLEPRADVSPQSAESMASIGGGVPPVSDSPGPMDIDMRTERGNYGAQPPAQMEDKSSTSLSYPGILSPSAAMPSPARGMSLPMTPNQQSTPRSPNSKKHKCPYCETEFTRHHNLKSHLLTHSQEKPYVCQTCQMRFRRLHDLKRHSKLHTGEKPHVCPKCERKFARGDALARHSKGPGGCVGRRSSLGGFGNDDDPDGSSHLEGDDSTMSGIVYDGANEADVTEEERRRLSLPSIKAQHVPGSQPVLEGYAPTSRTYPPGSTGGRLYPPNVEHGPAGTATGAVSGSAFAQNAMTESPKPLSPSGGAAGQDAGGIARQRSPSLTTQLQQQHFGRLPSDQNAPPVPGFTANDARYTASGQVASQGNSSVIPPASGSGAAAPTGAAGSGATQRPTSGPGQNGGSGDSTSNNLFATDQGIWVYIHNLEEQIRQLSTRVQTLEHNEKLQEEKLAFMSVEIETLRKQSETKAEAPEAMI